MVRVKLYLDTSGPTCKLRLDEKEYIWEAGHEMAKGIYKFIHGKLQENGADLSEITEIQYFSGPGSFTGLRIGAAVVNTLADQLGVPLHDETGARVKIILPKYGREANIGVQKR